MSPDIEFDFNTSMFTPPAPVVLAEWRSPAYPHTSNPERLPVLIDSGADCCAIPQRLIDNLHLCQVDECKVGGYNDKEEDLQTKPIYSAHLTIPPLRSRIIEVLPLDSRDYAIIGRNLINEWLLNLDGPNLKTRLRSTS